MERPQTAASEQPYRWNADESARTYDQTAHLVHPHYEEIQHVILEQLRLDEQGPDVVVDIGGGSGRLMHKVLERFADTTGVVLDQSQPFLDLARRKLADFADRAKFVHARLQDDWPASLPARPTAIISMSAIHHLDSAEKQALYRRCFDALKPGGVLLNGDEVRDDDDATHLAHLTQWAGHMQQLMDNRLVPESMHQLLKGWQHRNVTQFARPKVSGDDCHQTPATQCEYLLDSGFDNVAVVWQQAMWAVLYAVKPPIRPSGAGA